MSQQINDNDEAELQDGPIDKLIKSWERINSNFNKNQQIFLDRVNPWRKTRWAITAFITFLYVLRVFYLSGWYIVSYGLGIYMLNLFIAFLSPPIDPETDGPILPSKGVDDYRPFVRKLPEFKFWYATSKAFLVAIICTFVDLFNIPVFWPILLIYFLLLFFMTMKKEVQKWIKYGYLPFDIGKPKYSSKTTKI